MSSSQQDRVNPLNFSGVVGGRYRTEDHITENTELTGQSFLSRCCIPDIPRNAKIIGVCGINDEIAPGDPDDVGAAAPSRDGWFFSDFFLMHHLFKGVTTDQIWMTCVKPSDLVDKYGQYLHGDSNEAVAGQRRIVLNAAMLSEKDDILVIHPRELLERLLSTIRDECSRAEREDRPVLVMIFSHGRADTFSIQMGGVKSGINNPHLTLRKFKQCLGSQPRKQKLCLMTTACYSGGWAINPDMNITTMTAQCAWMESLSWPISKTINRACGSPYASAITEALIKMHVEDIGEEELEELRDTPTYAHLSKSITQDLHEMYNKNTHTNSGPSYNVNQPMFSAQDDEWEMSGSERIGIALSTFRGQWLKLREIGDNHNPPGGGFGLASTRKQATEPEITQLKHDAQEYLNSYPGLPNRSKNVALHSQISSLLSGRYDQIGGFEALRDQISYRMASVMAAATFYKNRLGIAMEDCALVDMDSAPQRGDPNFGAIRKIVASYPLFDEPYGQPFDKGNLYLAACIIKAGWDRITAEAKLDKLVKYYNKDIPGSGISSIPIAGRVVSEIDYGNWARDPMITKQIQTSLQDFAQKGRKKLRQSTTSPMKKVRIRDHVSTSLTSSEGTSRSD